MACTPDIAPVVVLGNGPVGQTTALLLARWGIPVIVTDLRPRRDLVGSKAICQQRDVLDIWGSVGAGEQITAEGVTWTTARTYYRDQEVFRHGFTDTVRSAYPPFVNISQSRTEEILDARIAASSLIDVRWACEVVDLRQGDEGVCLRCRTPDGETELHARYVVACSGARCRELHDALGVKFEGHSFEDKFLICDIRADLPDWARERRFFFDPPWNRGRQVLIHPCPDSTYRIDWQVPSSYDLAHDENTGHLDRRIRQIIGDRAYEIVWKSVYRFSSRLANTMAAGRVLLAGDCAHLMAPFGARGLNSGVQDAENAAWKLAFVLREWAPQELLTSYHDERHAAAVENLAITTATMDFLVPHTDEQRRVRRSTLERAATDPAARPLVDSGRLAEPFWYVDSPLTTASVDHPYGGRPSRGDLPAPGPGMLVPDVPLGDREEVRLREIARRGVTVLCAERADVAIAKRAAGSLAAPVQVMWLDAIDSTGAVRAALGVLPGEAWIVRPDAHVAAVVRGADGDAVAAAVRRSLCLPGPAR
ncbi:MAG: FAD-dependent monooxygenase [Nocardioidaceae bacterium]